MKPHSVSLTINMSAARNTN